MQSKISLGTVQFGLRYGIANQKGKISKKEVFDILKYAQDSAINCLDTAFTYGDSEYVIGSYLKGNIDQFQIISKLPSLDAYITGKAERFLQITLRRLSIKRLSGYLIHDFGNFLTWEALWTEFLYLKNKGLINKIGFSLYFPTELELLFKKNIEFDLVQIPYSIFDRRFERYFDILKKKRVEIHVRSVFLQGLAFLEPDQLRGNLLKAKGQIEILRKLAQSNNLSISAICLNYVLLNQYIDKVVIGIDGLNHLKENIRNLELSDQWHRFNGEFKRLMIEDEDILLPFRWKNVAK